MIYVSQGALDFRLSKNFTTDEFRCRCCGELKIDERLVAALQELRDLIKHPIFVTSGYRCPAHNRVVGVAKNSQHVKGKAADIRSRTVTSDRLAVLAEKVYAFGGIGVYSTFIHVDVRPYRARWKES